MRSVRSRLLWAFVAVAATAAALFSISVRVMVPRLFDRSVGRGQGAGPGRGPTAAQRDAVVSAVNTAVFVGLGTAVAVSVALAWWLSRREVRHLDRVRAAARALAGGDYRVRVTPPRERELAALAGDVNELAGVLEATERRRASLINDVAHEMRTPLTTIAGVVEGYHDGLFDVDEVVRTVEAESARLQRLTQDLAAVSRAEEGQLRFDRRDDDLAQLATDVATRLRPRFEAAGLELIVDCPSPVPVEVDRERIVEVITNLLDNALAYTPAPGTVTLRASVEANTARLEVADTGRGLSPEEISHVFERFYRAEPDHHAGGTGIGLTIARAISRAHGGDLIAASAGRGHGSTFTLTLPSPQHDRPTG